MTPVEVFERLGFSPIIQAIAGLAWFSVVLVIMMRAENNKRKPNGNSAPLPPTAIPVPDHLAKIADIANVSMELQRQNREKLAGLQIQINTIGESMKAMAAVREHQIEELISAVKESADRISGQRRWW